MDRPTTWIGTLLITDLDGDGRADGVGGADSVDGAEQWRQTSTLIEGFESAPRDLKIVDANRDGRGDLAVFGTHEGLRILLQQQDGSFAEASLSTGFRQGLVDGVSPSAFTSGDVNGDGSEEILVATDGYARSLKVADDGTS